MKHHLVQVTFVLAWCVTMADYSTHRVVFSATAFSHAVMLIAPKVASVTLCLAPTLLLLLFAQKQSLRLYAHLSTAQQCIVIMVSIKISLAVTLVIALISASMLHVLMALSVSFKESMTVHLLTTVGIVQRPNVSLCLVRQLHQLSISVNHLDCVRSLFANMVVSLMSLAVSSVCACTHARMLYAILVNNASLNLLKHASKATRVINTNLSATLECLLQQLVHL